MADKSSKKKTGLTLACIILAFLVIFIIFLVKKDAILTNLKETRFFERVFGSTPEFVENHTPSEKETVKIPLNPQADDVVIKVEPEQKKSAPKEETEKKDSAPQKVQEAEKAKESQAPAVKKEEKPAEKTKAAEPAYTDLMLCFIEIDGDGSINRKLVKRSVPKTDSPLTTAIKAVLAGPDTTKTEERNCISLVPEGTRLLGARVSGGVAYLDFNDSFEFNTNGVEGYNSQLMQLVYTATSFSTVNSVQFLIEGQKKDYLGSEGQWIGSPLSRTSF